MNQMLAGNSIIKYPLDPLSSDVVPHDFLLDLSVTVPEGMDPLLTNIIIGLGSLFITLETAAGDPVGHYSGPAGTGRIVNMTMSVPGFGWLVVGPAVDEEVRILKNIREPLDPSTTLRVPASPTAFSLVVDGKRYDMPDKLNIEGRGLVSDGSWAEGPELMRNDDTLSLTTRVSELLADYSEEAAVTGLAGAVPLDGNIDLTLEPSETGATADLIPITSDGVVIGLLITSSGMSDCPDETERLKKKILCRTDAGLSLPLPLDHVNCPDDIVCDEETPAP